MLVLSRGRGECIEIGGDREIRVEVVEIKPHRVRLGIAAPRGIPVHRSEVAEQVESDGDKSAERIAAARKSIGIDRQLGGSDVAKWVRQTVELSARGVDVSRRDLLEITRMILSEALGFASDMR